MIDIKNVIELVQEYNSISNITKKKEIFKLLVDTLKECNRNTSNLRDNLLKEESDLYG
jgi:hypothetical protein